ncbi:hypothetical protein ACTU45_30390 [Streptomyces sp. 24-1644]|uniref:hypothetical protein n=1 Tax=Streptomyces sp. 24-1644 TaxID=3457315 RepID=UPI003FA688B1
MSALISVSALMAGAAEPHGAGDVRVKHAAEMATLLSLAKERPRTAADRGE